METSLYLPILLIVGGIIFLILFFHYVPFFLWLSAKVSGVNISLISGQAGVARAVAKCLIW